MIKFVRRFTLLQSMFVVMVSAFLAALALQPARNWAGSITTFTAFLIATSSLLAAIKQGDRRDLWAGFAIFSGLYIVFTIGPGFDKIDSPILSNYILLEIYFNVAGVGDSRFLSDSSIVNTHRYTITPFLQMGHSVFAILVGAFGAMFARVIRTGKIRS